MDSRSEPGFAAIRRRSGRKDFFKNFGPDPNPVLLRYSDDLAGRDISVCHSGAHHWFIAGKSAVEVRQPNRVIDDPEECMHR
jgi:hypothetical protein